MKVYKYDELSKEFKGVEDAFLDPLETKLQEKESYLLPANATFKAPIEQEGYASVWNGKEWESVEDNRGKRYWLKTDTYGTPAREMKELGALPENVIFEPPVMTQEQKESQALLQAKEERSEAVSKIVVEVDGMLFDGDEMAQSRMSRAIVASDTANLDSTVWVLADNSVVTVTKTQLKLALSKAMLKMSELWIVPYKNKKN